MWTALAGVPATFGGDVVVSPGSALCPPGWSGVVTIENKAVVTAPTAAAAALLRDALAGLPVSDWTSPEALRARLPVDEFLGPATLAYCSALRPADTSDVTTGSWESLVASPEDAGEAGLDEITSPSFVIRSGGQVVAAAGYQRWPSDVAHLSVLTAEPFRGRGLARAVASAAVADALAAGLLPQWRARPEPSRRVARALGFTELGTQLSLRLTDPPPA